DGTRRSRHARLPRSRRRRRWGSGSFAPWVGLGHDVGRGAGALGNDREAVVLGDDPFDVADEVLGDDRELPGVAPDLLVLRHRDLDDAVARLQGAFAGDAHPATGRVVVVGLLD